MRVVEAQDQAQIEVLIYAVLVLAEVRGERAVRAVPPSQDETQETIALLKKAAVGDRDTVQNLPRIVRRARHLCWRALERV